MNISAPGKKLPFATSPSPGKFPAAIETLLPNGLGKRHADFFLKPADYRLAVVRGIKQKRTVMRRKSFGIAILAAMLMALAVQPAVRVTKFSPLQGPYLLLLLSD
jgi:hypothetical protein